MVLWTNSSSNEIRSGFSSLLANQPSQQKRLIWVNKVPPGLKSLLFPPLFRLKLEIMFQCLPSTNLLLFILSLWFVAMICTIFAFLEGNWSHKTPFPQIRDPRDGGGGTRGSGLHVCCVWDGLSWALWLDTPSSLLAPSLSHPGGAGPALLLHLWLVQSKKIYSCVSSPRLRGAGRAL